MENEEVIRNRQTIPHEIVFDILTRLPVKPLCRFRCVSKLWNSTISDPNFAKSHHNRRTLPRSDDDGTTLLITFPGETNIIRSLYTAANPRENKDSVVAVNLPTLSGLITSYVSESLNGLIFLEIDSKSSICNPTTREFITLPSVGNFGKEYLGYDPVNDQYKVLNTSVIDIADLRGGPIVEHRVFEFGDAYSWRRILDGPPHLPRGDSVCVNGVLYYRAWSCASVARPLSNVLVAFNLRLETFRFIQMPDGDVQLFDECDLIRFEGHLAIVDYQNLWDGNTMDIWVLEDALKPFWILKSIGFSSTLTNNLLEHPAFDFAGSTHMGEIILAPLNLRKPFYLFYFDLKNGSWRRVEIHGLPDYEFLGKPWSEITITDHVENIVSPSNLR